MYVRTPKSAVYMKDTTLAVLFNHMVISLDSCANRPTIEGTVQPVNKDHHSDNGILDFIHRQSLFGGSVSVTHNINLCQFKKHTWSQLMRLWF